ncbi:hypothetical protein [Amycolatopsis aidingensis]|uniref:hypothetical protein n=1 Tax=Amycolatopsis aidingensis TaxID=2842453 RepID=UPI001C0B6352|nr:hypothetical protein [Amycolatopsis aidingensis]
MTVTAAGALALTGTTTATATPAHTGPEHDTTLSLFRLKPVNDSRVRGIGVVELDGTHASIRITAFGVLRNHPHAQHFHIGGAGTCPTSAADTNGDGVVSTVEGAPSYGGVGASLTTTGDTSPDSALAVDRFPTAPRGLVRYHRSMDVSNAVARDLRTGNAVIVLHGLDLNGSGTYDGAARSSLDPSLPLEATAPASCGEALTVRAG